MLADGVTAAARAWPLAALGASRLLVVKGLDYQEHVSEYGVHWNFFATLFFLRVVVVPMNRLRPARLRHLLALVAIFVYQWWLVNGGLADFIVHAPRDTLFSMNREGVLGLVGFVAIYYIAEEVGSQVRTGREKPAKVRLKVRNFVPIFADVKVTALILRVRRKQNDQQLRPYFVDRVLGNVRMQGFTELRPSSKSMAIVMRATVILWGLTLLSEGFIQDTSRYVHLRLFLFEPLLVLLSS